MRFKIKRKPEIGDKRIRTKYLLFPVTISDKCRWLEFAKIKYERKMGTVSYDMGGVQHPEWVPVKFLPYDPVYDCEVFKEDGCSYIDGMLCDIDMCTILLNRKK